MKFRVITALIMCGFLAAFAAREPSMTPLEIQSMQTRQFDASYNTTFSSVMSVFQDIGYTVEAASKETGLITGQSATDSNVAYQIFTGSTLNTQTAATAFIEKLKGKTSVRLNFVQKSKTSSGWGQTNNQDIPITDVTIYQNAFERIESAIFLRQ